jgi:hypothetical protein
LHTLQLSDKFVLDLLRGALYYRLACSMAVTSERVRAEET